MTIRRALALLLGVAVLAGITFITLPYYHGLSLVVRAADLDGEVLRHQHLSRMPAIAPGSEPIGRRSLDSPAPVR